VGRGWLGLDLGDVGVTPDYRWSLANERTFLAWIRTALALIGAGLAVAQFLPALPIPYGREAIAVALVALGAASAVRAVRRWYRCERAMRLGEDLPPSRFPALLAVVLAFGGVLLVLGLVTGR
jgi:putative membrane protein